jgi:hypothetical protein
MATFQKYTEKQQLAVPQIGQAALAGPVQGLDARLVGQSPVDRALWDAVDKTVNAAGRAAAQEINERREIRVTEAVTRYRKTLSDQAGDYMDKNKGELALDAGKVFADEAEKTRDVFLEELEGDEEARRMFGRAAQGAALHHAENGTAYARREKEVWKKSVVDGMFAQYEQDVAANWRNADFVEHQRQVMKERVREMYPGLDHTAMNADIDARAVDGRIGAMLAAGQTGAARALFQKEGALLGAGADNVMARIRHAEDSATARAEAAENRKLRELADVLPGLELTAMRTGDMTGLDNLAAGLGGGKLAAKLKERIGEIKEVSGFTYELSSLPFPEAMAKFRELDARMRGPEHESDPKAYERMGKEYAAGLKLLADRARALKDDPAEAVSDRVFAPDDDPAGKAAERLEQQAKNGVPESARKVLTNTEAASLKESWGRGDLHKRLGIAALLEQYGVWAGQAAAEAGIGPAEQFLPAQARHDPRAAERLGAVITAASLKPEELPKRDAAQTLTYNAVQDSQTLKGYKALASLWPSNAALQETARKLEDTLGKLVLTTGAAEDATATLDGRVRALTDGNFALVYDPGAFADAGDLEAGLRDALMPGGALEEFLTGLTFETPHDRADRLAHLRRVGRWINAPDGDGWVLFDPVAQAPLMDGKGAVLRLRDKDLTGAVGRREAARDAAAAARDPLWEYGP